MLIVKLIREKRLLSIKMKCDCQMVRKHIQAQDINSNQTFQVETSTYDERAEIERSLAEEREIAELMSRRNEETERNHKKAEELMAQKASQAASAAEQSAQAMEAGEQNPTESQTTYNPVTRETETVPEGAVEVKPTEAEVVVEPTLPPAMEEPTTESYQTPIIAEGLIETTEESIANGLWPHNSSTNNPRVWLIPGQLDAQRAIAEAWCNNGNGGASDEETVSKLNAVENSGAAAVRIQFQGRSIDEWTFTMDILTEEQANAHSFSYFRTFYDPSTDTTTVWYTYNR